MTCLPQLASALSLQAFGCFSSLFYHSVSIQKLHFTLSQTSSNLYSDLADFGASLQFYLPSSSYLKSLPLLHFLIILLCLFAIQFIFNPPSKHRYIFPHICIQFRHNSALFHPSPASVPLVPPIQSFLLPFCTFSFSFTLEMFQTILYSVVQVLKFIQELYLIFQDFLCLSLVIYSFNLF